MQIMQTISRLIYLMPVAVLLMLSGCGGSQNDQNKTNEDVIDKTGKAGPALITVTTPGDNMQNMRFDVQRIKIKAGQQVQLTLKNVAPKGAAAMHHNFVVVKTGKAKTVAGKGMKAGEAADYLPEDKSNLIAHTKMLDPGETTRIEFTIDKAGQYKFICTYPGHFPTMQGTIEVK